MSGLEKEFPGRVRAENVDATTPESKKEVQALGFETHGLVIKSADGKVLWKAADHKVKIEDVRNALQDLLK